MALALRKTKAKHHTPDLALEARSLAPDDPWVSYLTYWAVEMSVPSWHFSIVQDAGRNAIYAEALKRLVEPGMLVLEIGTGTGLLAMLAAQAGAELVITCEKEPLVAKQAQTIINRNGWGDKIKIVSKDLHELRLGIDLPRPADLLVAEIVGSTLLGESVLPLYAQARQHLLRPEAIILPRIIAARGMLVGNLPIEKCHMGEVMGFDLSPFNALAPSVTFTESGGGRFAAYSEAVELFRFDLQTGTYEDRGRCNLSLPIIRSGEVQGFMQWIWMDFGADLIFENRPPVPSSWWPMIHLFRQKIAVQPGEIVNLVAEHDRKRIIVWSKLDDKYLPV